MNLSGLVVLSGLSGAEVYAIVSALKRTHFKRGTMGRPFALSALKMVLLVLVWLRGNWLQGGVGGFVWC